MGLFGKPRIVDPYNTMGTAPQKPSKARVWVPACLDQGDMEGIPLEDVARKFGLTLEAAAEFRDSWNEACKYRGKPRGERAWDDLADVKLDPKNWKRW